MRKWIELFENNRVKDATRTDTFDIGVAPDSLGDLAAPSSKTSDVSVPGKSASGAKTRAAIHAPLDAQSHAHLSDLAASGLTDEIDDAEAAQRAGIGMGDAMATDGAEPTPINPENLPSVIRNDMAAMGDAEFSPAEFNPEWHQVKHLPGYMQSAIRAMGRMVFTPFTDTPIEDIQVLSTLSNPVDDVKKMMKWITMNGIKDDAAHLEFQRIMPGYAAQTVIYNTDDCTFMMVSDHMGKYVYGWPGGRGVQLSGPAEMHRLESMDPTSRNNLRELSELSNPLETAYRRFMEGPNDPNSPVSFVAGDKTAPNANGDNDEMDVDPTQQGTPQPNTPAPKQTTTTMAPDPTQSQQPQGTGQSNSTNKPSAPGQQPPQGQQQPPMQAPAPDRANLNPAQQAAKAKIDAMKAAALGKS